MRDAMTGTYFYGDKAYEFSFYTDLSSYDKLTFVNSVVDTLVDSAHYNSVIRDLVFNFNIIDLFTDVDTSLVFEAKDDNGDSINSIIMIEHVLENTNIVDIVVANMRDGLINELNKSIDLNIEYLTGIHYNALNSALASLVNTIESKINDIDIGSMSEMANMFVGMSDKFTVDNVVNAYINSDMHKDNLNEVKKAKKTNKKAKNK